jgi:hypothetical protein
MLMVLLTYPLITLVTTNVNDHDRDHVLHDHVLHDHVDHLHLYQGHLGWHYQVHLHHPHPHLDLGHLRSL